MMANQTLIITCICNYTVGKLFMWKIIFSSNVYFLHFIRLYNLKRKEIQAKITTSASSRKNKETKVEEKLRKSSSFTKQNVCICEIGFFLSQILIYKFFHQFWY